MRTTGHVTEGGHQSVLNSEIGIIPSTCGQVSVVVTAAAPAVTPAAHHLVLRVEESEETAVTDTWRAGGHKERLLPDVVTLT